MQLGSPIPRPVFAYIVSNTRCLYTVPVNSGRKENEAPQAQLHGSSQKTTSRFHGGKALFYLSGLGICSTSLYFLLVNGPSRSAPTSSSAPLSPTHFTPVTLTASVPCTPYTKLLTLKLPHHLIPGPDARVTPIYSIYVKDSDIQVERPYTPLEGIDERGQMHFWVKRYQGGEVGRWLHERKVGDEIEIRGTIPTWKWKDGEWDEIIMISGGTGITPFYQLIHSVLSGRGDGDTMPRTRFTLLHSSPTPADLPPRVIMDPLQAVAQKHPGSFALQVYVDTPDPKTGRRGLPRLATGRIGRKAVEEALLRRSANSEPWWRRYWRSSRTAGTEGRKVLFLVCGPEPMITAIAGPRGRNLGQGGVGGILGEMGFESHQVCKI
ncbi:ferredoxin reductase-like C-terminal NADP-linked domain-containing protein [Hysterangium stoloniferum]|nr:ferredoxin reductase-like C-terminal NADP-linked domain-containing protein [Hysterangium stoloniferum]